MKWYQSVKWYHLIFLNYLNLISSDIGFGKKVILLWVNGKTKRCPVIKLFIPYFLISRSRLIVLLILRDRFLISFLRSFDALYKQIKASFPINEVTCLQTLLYWSENSKGIHDIQWRGVSTVVASWVFSSCWKIHTKFQHFVIKQKINQWILKFFISGIHFAKNPVSVWAFDYKQLVFETGFKNRI